MLHLKEANWLDAEAEYAFVREIPVDENGFTNKWYGCDWDTFMEKALPEMLDYAAGKNLPEGFVPETFCFLWDEDVIVGEFRIRHYLCESLRVGAGHIGYYIGKEFRGRGYAKEGLRLTLRKAKEIVPEEEIYLRVNKNNPASLCVMLHNGGYIRGEDEKSYFVRIRKETIPDPCDGEFWAALDTLVKESEIIIDRPRGSAHPRYPHMIYRVDYGYLRNTSSMDGEGIDVWLGTHGRDVDAVMCIVDLFKRDSEIKILVGCNEEEKQIVYETHNESEYMKGILIRRPKEKAKHEFKGSNQ